MRQALGVEVFCQRCGRERRCVRAGTYGAGGQRRQLLRCSTCGHHFAEPLPRAVVPAGATCVECLNDLGPHQGHPHPRLYEFSAPTIAQALVRVASGRSYRASGELVRARTGRRRRNARATPKRAASRENGNLVMDWVEAFTTPVWAEHGHTSWPDLIAVDEHIVGGHALAKTPKPMFPASSKPPPGPRTNRALGRGKGGRRLFTIIGAEGYPIGGRAQPWLLRAAPTADVAEWAAFFGSLSGQPSVVVGDAGHAWQVAVKKAWPTNTPEVVISEFHLRQMAERHLLRLRVPLGDALWDLLGRAFYGPTEWADFVSALAPTAVRDRGVRKWLRRWTKRVADQLARHTFRPTTRSTGGVEQTLKAVERRIGDRRHMFANRERTNRLLLLMVLDLSDRAHERIWATTVRSWLASRGGRPPSVRQIADPVGGPRQASSLRLGGARL